MHIELFLRKVRKRAMECRALILNSSPQYLSEGISARLARRASTDLFIFLVFSRCFSSCSAMCLLGRTSRARSFSFFLFDSLTFFLSELDASSEITIALLIVSTNPVRNNVIVPQSNYSRPRLRLASSSWIKDWGAIISSTESRSFGSEFLRS